MDSLVNLMSKKEEAGAMSTDLAQRLLGKDGSVRRIVTGLREGKSVVIEDAEVPARDLLGAKVTELWQTSGEPVLQLESDKCKIPLTFKMPAPGETRVRLTIIPPEEISGSGAGMHQTKTVDYDILLSGELWMEMDDGVAVQLNPGDCVIQNGTRHAWRNRSKQNCIMLTMCVGGK